jgi:thiosulfate reductase cytochrome b subunit
METTETDIGSIHPLWLDGAIQWNFAAMRLLAGNGLISLWCNVASGRLAEKFIYTYPGGCWKDPGYNCFGGS